MFGFFLFFPFAFFSLFFVPLCSWVSSSPLSLSSFGKWAALWLSCPVTVLVLWQTLYVCYCLILNLIHCWSWWSQWGCYDSWSMPQMTLLKVPEHVSDHHCCSTMPLSLGFFIVSLGLSFISLNLFLVCYHIWNIYVIIRSSQFCWGPKKWVWRIDLVVIWTRTYLQSNTRHSHWL